MSEPRKKLSKSEKKVFHRRFKEALREFGRREAPQANTDVREACLTFLKNEKQDLMTVLGMDVVRRWYAAHLAEACGELPVSSMGGRMVAQQNRHLARLVRGDDETTAINHDFRSYREPEEDEGEDHEALEADGLLNFQGVEALSPIVQELSRIGRMGYGSEPPEGLIEEVREAMGRIKPWPELVPELEEINRRLYDVYLDYRVVPLADVALEEEGEPVDPALAKCALAASIREDKQMQEDYRSSLAEVLGDAEGRLAPLAKQFGTRLEAIRRELRSQEMSAFPKLLAKQFKVGVFRGGRAYDEGLSQARQNEETRKAQREQLATEKALLTAKLDVLQKVRLLLSSVLEGEILASRIAQERVRSRT